jgi:D-amino-acid oxidase
MSHAIVLGCGVSGLSTGIRFLEEGAANRAEIWARELPPDTTSNIAAAIWYPYRALPFERVLGWGKRTLDLFYEMAGDAATGISVREAVEYFRHEPVEPWWHSSIRRFRYLRPEECQAPFSGGYRFETVVIETAIYLPYLMRQFGALGGVIRRREVTSLDEATAEADVVFNCTGLGSYALLGDRELFPVRGQVMRAARPASEICYLDDEEDESGVFAYIVPRSNDCVLGGTAPIGNWSREPDPEVAARILERCAAMNPEVRRLEILEHRVGLRPGRSSVRVEAERVAGGKVVAHNYGHGGAGVTLSWGCAEEVVALAQRL